jgi:hypothetical protein
MFSDEEARMMKAAVWIMGGALVGFGVLIGWALL